MTEKLEIVTDQSILTRKSNECTSKNEADAVAALLIETIKHLHGRAAGLAAIQIGLPIRIFVVNIYSDQFAIFVNPTIACIGLPYQSTESCLSLPDRTFTVSRYSQVVCRSVDFSGVKFKTITYFHDVARIIQHEFDHLDGRTLLQTGVEKL